MFTATEALHAETAADEVARTWVAAARRPPVAGPRTWRGIALAVALLGALAVCLALRRAYPDGLRGRTDVVGYPVFADFDVRAYFVNYLLLVVVFPALAVLFYGGLTAVAHRPHPGARLPLLPAVAPAARPADPDPAAYSWPVALGRSAVVGAVFAAGVVIAVGAAPGRVVPLGLAVVGGYVAAVFAAGVVIAVGAVPGRVVPPGLAAGRVTQRLPVVAAVNALAAPFTVLALVAASAASTVTVVATDRVVPYPWLPVPVAALAIAGGVAAVGCQLRRAGAERWPAVERWAVLLGPGPVAVWLLTSRLNVNVGTVDLFHEGEVLAATQRVVDGAFPWRDVLFIHGLLGDVVPGLLARAVFGDTRWALFALGGAVLTPLYWVGNYFVCVYLFRRNWLLLVASQALVVLGTLSFTHFRLVLQAYLLLLLGALLRAATWPRAAGVAVVAVAQFVVAPEASYFSVAACGVVLVHDVVHRRPGQPLMVAFRRTLRTGAAAVGVLVAFVGFLVANRALDPFLDYYRTFVAGHELSGGLPITRVGSHVTFDVWMAAPVLVVLATWWYVVARVRSRRWLTTQDWVVVAAVTGLLPYYSKFLSRAEMGHLAQVAASAAVPLLYVGYRLVEEVESPLRRWRSWAMPVSAAVLAAAVVFSPVAVRPLVDGLAGRWREVAAHESPVARMGYEDGTPLDPDVVRDLDAVLRTYLGDDGSVFDFTNSPGLFGFLLDHRHATRYFHVSMAIPEAVQRDLVAELERDRPELVVVDSTRYGLPSWDGVNNAVRHYLVSDYLLDHYEPLLGLHGYTLLRRADLPERPLPPLSERPATDDPYLGAKVCDWGHAPAFLRLQPGDDARRVAVSVRPAAPVVSARGWAVDQRTRQPVREVLVVAGAEVVGRFTPGGDRPDVATFLADPAATPSGFAASVALPATIVTTGTDLRLFGLTSSGAVGEIPGVAGSRSPRAYVVDGTTRRAVVEGAVAGFVDELQPPASAYVLDLPPDAATFDWLEVETAPSPDTRFTLTGPTGSSSVAFTPHAGSSSTRVLVSACPPWHDFGPTALLHTSTPTPVLSVHLVQ